MEKLELNIKKIYNTSIMEGKKKTTEEARTKAEAEAERFRQQRTQEAAEEVARARAKAEETARAHRAAEEVEARRQQEKVVIKIEYHDSEINSLQEALSNLPSIDNMRPLYEPSREIASFDRQPLIYRNYETFKEFEGLIQRITRELESLCFQSQGRSVLPETERKEVRKMISSFEIFIKNFAAATNILETSFGTIGSNSTILLCSNLLENNRSSLLDRLVSTLKNLNTEFVIETPKQPPQPAATSDPAPASAGSEGDQPPATPTLDRKRRADPDAKPADFDELIASEKCKSIKSKIFVFKQNLISRYTDNGKPVYSDIENVEINQNFIEIANFFLELLRAVVVTREERGDTPGKIPNELQNVFSFFDDFLYTKDTLVDRDKQPIPDLFPVSFKEALRIFLFNNGYIARRPNFSQTNSGGVTNSNDYVINMDKPPYTVKVPSFEPKPDDIEIEAEQQPRTAMAQPEPTAPPAQPAGVKKPAEEVRDLAGEPTPEDIQTVKDGLANFEREIFPISIYSILNYLEWEDNNTKKPYIQKIIGVLLREGFLVQAPNSFLDKNQKPVIEQNGIYTKKYYDKIKGDRHPATLTPDQKRQHRADPNAEPTEEDIEKARLITANFTQHIIPGDFAGCFGEGDDIFYDFNGKYVFSDDLISVKRIPGKYTFGLSNTELIPGKYTLYCIKIIEELIKSGDAIRHTGVDTTYPDGSIQLENGLVYAKKFYNETTVGTPPSQPLASFTPPTPREKPKPIRRVVPPRKPGFFDRGKNRMRTAILAGLGILGGLAGVSYLGKKSGEPRNLNKEKIEEPAGRINPKAKNKKSAPDLSRGEAGPIEVPKPSPIPKTESPAEPPMSQEPTPPPQPEQRASSEASTIPPRPPRIQPTTPTTKPQTEAKAKLETKMTEEERLGKVFRAGGFIETTDSEGKKEWTSYYPEGKPKRKIIYQDGTSENFTEDGIKGKRLPMPPEIIKELNEDFGFQIKP